MTKGVWHSRTEGEGEEMERLESGLRNNSGKIEEKKILSLDEL